MSLQNFVAGLGDPYAMATTQEQAYQRIRQGKNAQIEAEKARRQYERDERQYADEATPIPELPGLPMGASRWPTPQGGVPTPGARGAPAVAAPSATGRARGVYTAPQPPTENQSAAESRRLAGKITPAEAGAAGERPGLRTPALEKAKSAAQTSRYEQLKKLNPPVPQAAQSAAETARLDRSGEPGRRPTQDAGFEAFKNAIFGQESGNGRVDTSRPNYAGALGKGQILQSTFDGLKRQGKIPAHYQWTNPQHNEEAAVAYMREAWQAAGGNPELAAAYYYGGPKAVANGQIVTYRDLKNPNAPTTNQYAQQVLQRMGPAGVQSAPGSNMPMVSGGAPASNMPMVSGGAPASNMPMVSASAPGLPQQQAAPAAIDRSALGGGTGYDERDLQYQRLLLSDMQRQLQNAATSERRQQIRAAMLQMQGNIMHGELQGVSQRAQAGDPQAVDQLAQMAQVQYASTPQGLVSVTVDPYTGQGRAASQPMDVPTFSRMLFQRASSRIQQAMIQAMPEQAKQAAQMQREVAVEGVKGQNKLLEIEAQAERDIQQKLIEFNMQGENYQVSRDPMGTGAVLVTTRRGVFEYIPAKVVNGVQMESELKPVQR